LKVELIELRIASIEFKHVVQKVRRRTDKKRVRCVCESPQTEGQGSMRDKKGIRTAKDNKKEGEISLET